ncbi:hypothetical protein [Mycolicibacterium goodii]|uniref:Uncharacterized protein n=1 Tax=Mycolicibacterium goodii TaxID=134601 RepID=A0ABS6HLJ2_MYCGD|nr:hypothetical protein [Mycolicibacterium goodii]OKH64099.1 hypothetical protein EB74_11295 [Mycobacterium sp. SWH-M5]MBU8811588.1 hypothetical protein [Mycolicibacterium goodii]MBU8822233.1 hypothetical protein [Mycolicibacterium goodii]MBU8828609.1 hypothetical protein [Mycolicibacterium goodii]MBU8834810.1 hypothetical protein [Mycolicibacterium goodii]
MTPPGSQPIPPLQTATDPVRCAEDMRNRWRALVGGLVFTERLLWVGFVGADLRLHKTMSQVPLRARPQPGRVEYVVSRLSRVLAGLDPGSTVAFLLSRPGRGPLSGLDRDWAALLTTTAARYGVPLQPIFRANDEAVVEVPTPLRAAG